MSLVTKRRSIRTTALTTASLVIGLIAIWVGIRSKCGGGGGGCLSSGLLGFFSTPTSTTPKTTSSSTGSSAGESAATAADGDRDDKTTDDDESSELIPLHFEFRGYSVWLELEQHNGDLEMALDIASQDLNVHRIPSPHVTVEYGISHLSEQEMIERFRQLQRTIQSSSWPPFVVKGIHTDVTFDGVDSEIMSMAWIEMTLGSSKQHQNLVEEVKRVFYADTNNDDDDDESNENNNNILWKPHLSLVYENPDMAKLNLHYSMTIMKRVPTLTSVSQRRVVGISLWKTQGKMESWYQLERYDLN